MPPDLNQLDTDAPMGAGPDAGPMSADISSMPDPQQMDIPNSEVDHEGAMAKADLYKLANYSLKLFKKIQDDDQLEAWVQAKITKAADYIASVYHYLEYEMKFSEYGHKLDNSDVMNEGQKRILINKLNEAKAKVAELKKAQAEKVKEGSSPKEKQKSPFVDRNSPESKAKIQAARDKAAKDTAAEPGKKLASKIKEKTVKEETSSTGGEIIRGKGVTRHKQNPNRFSDEEHTEPKSQAKSQSAAEKEDDRAADKAEEREGKNWEKRFGKDSVTRVKDGKKFEESKKGSKGTMANKDYDQDGRIETGKAEVMGSRMKAAAKAGKPFKEAASNIPATATTTVPGQRATGADLKKANSSAALGEGTCNHSPEGKKCPVHGLKECGMYEAKPSAGLSKAKKSAVVKDAKAGKDIGKPGKSFDKTAKAAGGGEKGEKIAAAAMWKNIKETQTYIAEKAKDEKPDYADLDDDGDETESMKDAAKQAKKETIKESTELDRMKTIMQRLNG